MGREGGDTGPTTLESVSPTLWKEAQPAGSVLSGSREQADSFCQSESVLTGKELKGKEEKNLTRRKVEGKNQR